MTASGGDEASRSPRAPIRRNRIWLKQRRERTLARITHPKRTVAALATGLVAVGVAVGSGADFSDEAANPNNVFVAGSLTIDNERENFALLSAQNLVPGAPAKTGTVDIKNSGSI